MQTTAKVTEITVMTATDLAAIESFFSGAGMIAISYHSFLLPVPMDKVESHNPDRLELTSDTCEQLIFLASLINKVTLLAFQPHYVQRLNR